LKQGAISKLLMACRILPVLLCLGFVIFYLFSGDELSVEAILSYSPKQPVLAALFLFLLYALKSLSVVFPILIIQMVSGMIFSPAAAFCVNLLGMAIVLTLPYWVGRFSGAEPVERLLTKYPKAAAILTLPQKNQAFASFFLRVITALPGDLVSMYLGSLRIPFGTYLGAGMLGTFMHVMAATLIGSSISDPTSPIFLLSILLTVLLAVGSLLVYRWYLKKNKGKEEQNGTKMA